MRIEPHNAIRNQHFSRNGHLMAGPGKSLAEFMQLQLVEAPAAPIHMYSPLFPATPLPQRSSFQARSSWICIRPVPRGSLRRVTTRLDYCTIDTNLTQFCTSKDQLQSKMAPSDKEIEDAILQGTCEVYENDPSDTSVNKVRKHVEEKLSLEDGSLSNGEWKTKSKNLIKQRVVSQFTVSHPVPTC